MKISSVVENLFFIVKIYFWQFRQTLIDNDIFDEDDFDKLQNAQILISTKCTDYNNWKKNGNVTFKPLIVSVNYDWTSYKDWFGYFDSNNTFKPATTLIADYYNFVNDNENIPFGVVVFKDFNKIMPEIYLEEFFGNIQLNGYIDLIFLIHYILKKKNLIQYSPEKKTLYIPIYIYFPKLIDKCLTSLTGKNSIIIQNKYNIKLRKYENIDSMYATAVAKILQQDLKVI